MTSWQVRRADLFCAIALGAAASDVEGRGIRTTLLTSRQRSSQAPSKRSRHGSDQAHTKMLRLELRSTRELPAHRSQNASAAWLNFLLKLLPASAASSVPMSSNSIEPSQDLCDAEMAVRKVQLSRTTRMLSSLTARTFTSGSPPGGDGYGVLY